MSFSAHRALDLGNDVMPPAGASMLKGVTSKNRRDKFKDPSAPSTYRSNVEVDDEQWVDPLRSNGAVAVSFSTFLLFFYKTTSLDLLILKALFPDKQRKLSHLIAVFGH